MRFERKLTIEQKRKKAANTAVRTQRLNKLSLCDTEQVIALINEILALEIEWDNDVSTDAIIAREIGKTSLASFLRYNDRNNLTRSLVLQYISIDKAMPLDIQAMWMSENYSCDIDPGDIAAFMVRYDRGVNDYPGLRLWQEKKEEFKDLTGFNFPKDFCLEYLKSYQAAAGGSSVPGDWPARSVPA